MLQAVRAMEHVVLVEPNQVWSFNYTAQVPQLTITVGLPSSGYHLSSVYVRRPGQPMCYINGVMPGVVYMALVVYESPSYLNASVATSTVGVYRQPLDDVAHKKAVAGNWTMEHYSTTQCVHCHAENF